MKRLILIASTVGALLAGASMFFEYEFCVDGPGRGIPLAISHPAHGPVLWEVPYSGNALDGMVIDGKGVVADLLFWSIIIGLPIALVDRRWHKRVLHSTPNEVSDSA